MPQNDHRKPLGGHTGAYTHLNLKGAHLERAHMMHEQHRAKMSQHGVLIETNPDQKHVNLEKAYKMHHEGHEFGNVLAAMSTPHEIQMLHEARRREMHSQDINEPREVYHEKI
jgi:hypothetical protein